MNTIPMKVETKVMAFVDSLSTAPDGITGVYDIVAFRACALKTGDSHSHTQSNPGKNPVLYTLSYT